MKKYKLSKIKEEAKFISCSTSYNLKVKNVPEITGSYAVANAKAKLVEIDDYLYPSTGYYSLIDAMVSGKGLILHKDLKLLYGEEICIRSTDNYLKLLDSDISISHDELYAYTKEKKTTIINEKAALITTGPMHIYGHWLLDIIPRLTYILNDILNERLKILLPSSVPSFALQLLELWGINSSHIIRYDPVLEKVLVSELIVPTVFRIHYWCHPKISNLFNRFYDESITPLRKLFLTRSNWHKQQRRLLNLTYIEATLERMGYDIISPEKYSIKEQIRIFQSAKEITGEFGSAIHNSLFAKNHINITVLKGNNMCNLTQLFVGQSKNQTTKFIFGESINKRRNGISSDYLIHQNDIKNET